MHPPETITTERLLLRRAGPDDAHALFDTYASDPQATRHLSWPTHDSVDETVEFLDDAAASWAEGREFIWVLIPQDHADAVGAIGAAPGPHGVEIGYVLGRAWWGRGLATEALIGVMDWLRAQPVVYRIWAYCAFDHLRSARVLERGGMTYEAMLRRWVLLPNLADEPVDALVFAWTRPAEAGGAESSEAHAASTIRPGG
jgi:RimJ/RimL family protein N-acetyltransferase